MSRTEDRDGFDLPVRVRLLESDMDKVETDIAAIRATLNKFVWAIAMAAVTLATSSILLALNLVGGK